jgi:hypothetical protein
MLHADKSLLHSINQSIPFTYYTTILPVIQKYSDIKVKCVKIL